MRAADGTISDILRARVDVDVVLASLLINVLSLAVPVAILQIFKRVIPNQSYGTLSGILIFLLLASALNAMLRTMRDKLLRENARQVERRLNHILTQKILWASADRLSGFQTEDLKNRLTGLRQLQPLFMRQSVVMWIDLIFAMVFVLIISVLSPQLAVVPLTLMLVVLVLTTIWNQQCRKGLRGAQDYDRRQMSFLLDVLLNPRRIKLHSAEPFLLRRYDMLQAARGRANASLFTHAEAEATTVTMVGSISTGFLACVGGLLSIQGRLGLAELSACILLSGRAMQPIVQALFANADDAKSDQLIKEIDEILALETRIALPVFGPPDRAATLTFRGLKSDHSSEINGVFPAGSVVAMTDDGSGRACALLIKLAQKSSRGLRGRVFVDDTDWRRVPFGPQGLVCLRDTAGLLDGDLLENLVSFTGRKSERLAFSAAKDLGLDEELRTIPAGPKCAYSGPGRGPGSPGFYQKIKLTSAIARQPKLLLIEAAGQRLDISSQKFLAAKLQSLRQQTTTLVSNPCTQVLEQADYHIHLFKTGESRVTALRARAEEPLLLQETDRYRGDIA